MPALARTLDQLLQDFRNAVAKFDPDNSTVADIRKALADKLPFGEWDEEYLLYHRLLSYLWFFQREQHRLEKNLHLLRPIAAAEAIDTPVQPDVKAHLAKQKPKKAWLELLNPLSTSADADRMRTLQVGRDVHSVMWSPGDRFLAAILENGTDFIWDKESIIWDVEAWQRVNTFYSKNSDQALFEFPHPDWLIAELLSVGSAGPIDRLSWANSSNGLFLATVPVLRGDIITIWNNQSEQTRRKAVDYPGSADVTWSPDGRYLASYFDGKTVIWDSNVSSVDGAMLPIKTMKVGELPVWRHDGRMLAQVYNSHEVSIKRSGTWKQTCKLSESQVGYVYSIAWSPDGCLLATGGSDGVSIWNTTTWQSEGSVLGGHSVEVMSWRPGSRILVAGDRRGAVTLWEYQDEENDWVCIQLGKHDGWVTSMSWSRNGRHLVTGGWGEDDRMILWSVERKLYKIAKRLLIHSSTVTSISWSHDDYFLASVSCDQTIIIWDMASHTPLIRLPLESTAFSIAFDPAGCQLDGSYRLAIGQSNGWVRIYKFHPAQPASRVLKRSP